MIARIYCPPKNAMQSGDFRLHPWVLEFVPEIPLSQDFLMGYVASREPKRQIRLFFDSEKEAIAYATRNNIPHECIPVLTRKRVIRKYADNFASDRATPWTH